MRDEQKHRTLQKQSIWRCLRPRFSPATPAGRGALGRAPLPSLEGVLGACRETVDTRSLDIYTAFHLESAEC
jgi:hypothetical protein